MPNDLLLPFVLLVGVLIASLILFRVDGRRARLQSRVDDLPDFRGIEEPDEPEIVDIRRSVRNRGKVFEVFAKAIGLLVDLEAAKVVSNKVVFAVGLLVAAAVALFARIYVTPLVAALIGLAVGFFAVRGIFRWEFDRYARKLRNQLPDAIELMLSTTNAGLSVADGIRTIAREMPAPTGNEFRRVAEEVALGTAVDVAVRTLHHRTLVPEYAILSVTLSVQSKSGGRLADTIATLAETVRQRIALESKAHALSGEARLSAAVLSVLPFVGAGLMSAIKPGFLLPLFYDERGQRLLLIGVITLTLGIMSMRWLIKGVTKE